MWRNYFVVGLRALAKNKTYAFINIVGLAIGLAACLLILLYVRYETSYDAWLPDAERVYQVQSVNTDPETGEVTVLQATHGAVAEPLAKDFPQIEAIARADTTTPVFLRDGEATFAPMTMTDENFFRILQIPFLRGDRETALAGMDALVLSRTEAMNRFGSIDIIGEEVTSVRRGEQQALRVTGVFEDIPRNSHLNLGLVGRISEQDITECSWGCINGFVYLKLRPGADPEDIHRQLPAWEARNIPRSNVGGAMVGEGDAFDWRLVNVRDVHLSEAESESIERPSNDRRTILTFAVVALLILGMACVNFVNLATARASQRAREVALRKVLGAHRRQLIVQFLGESMLLTGFAMLLAVALVELALPYLSAFLASELSLTYWGMEGILLPILGLWLAVGLAGGLYPAFYLSRFQPAHILKANKSSTDAQGSGRLRNALVVAQFAVSIGLIICTAIVYAQTVFARTADPGYTREGLIQVGNMTRAAVIPLTETLVREIERVDGVESVSGTNITVASGRVLNTSVQVPGRQDPLTIGWYSVQPNFAETMGIRLLAGRHLSRDFANDYAWTPYEPAEAVEPAQRALVARGINVVVNALAARRMGLGGPAEAVGKQIGVNMFNDLGLTPATIVGVVGDSRFRSIREPVEPMIFFDRGIYSDLVIRYSSANPEMVRQNIELVWRRLVPEVPFQGEFADAQVSQLYLTEAARGQTFAGFALLAVVIACLGLFGLAAFTAERRTKEIGIRKVFGARSRDIVRLLAWQFSKPVILANLIAWPVAWWVMRDWLNTFDARIALGPGPFLLAGLIALAIAIGTIAGHALKVSRANPIHALRYE
ncbi:MAG: ABC transporter permease [Allosphingosinicella sp.]|uniref:ABC transporter permease n=1 Tax=Allosphingosinicella sp. TaxID=2823234 RepID=UPI003926F3A5